MDTNCAKCGMVEAELDEARREIERTNDAYEASLRATYRAEAEARRLREALTRVRECAKGIMPIHENLDSLRTTILKFNDARWTRLFAIYAEADAALTPPALEATP